MERRKAELKKKYRDRLEEAFRDTLRELERLRRQRARSSDVSSATALSRQIRKYREEIFSEGGLFHEPPPVPEAGSAVDWSTVRCGDTVYLPALQADARILKMPDRKGTVLVEAKGFRLQVETSRVFKPTVQKRTIKTGDSGHRPYEQVSWSLQASETPVADGSCRCDLRGLTVEDALDRTSRLLDKAFREHTPRMILIHGLGKGILRDAIRQSLSRGPYPVSFRPGRPEEGGDGVTVVEFEPAGFPSR